MCGFIHIRFDGIICIECKTSVATLISVTTDSRSQVLPLLMNSEVHHTKIHLC